jgi:plastocyanin
METFVPDRDLFFMEEKELAFFGIELAEVLMVPIKEFMAHGEYKRLQLANSYLYWNIAARFSHVLVAQPDWIDRLAPPKKQRIFAQQVDSGRGLVFPSDMLPEIPAGHTVEVDGAVYAVVQHAVWQRLSSGVKERFLKEYALLWDRPEGYVLPDNAPAHLGPFANRYSERHGSNCLSATLFAATGQAWIAGEWVHPGTFGNSLQRLGFEPSSNTADAGDIVVWSSKKGVVQHAAFCLGNGLFFNKNGQTFFNPWKVIERQELDAVWAHLDQTVFVRQ